MGSLREADMEMAQLIKLGRSTLSTTSANQSYKSAVFWPSTEVLRAYPDEGSHYAKVFLPHL